MIRILLQPTISHVLQKMKNDDNDECNGDNNPKQGV
jgi:hypothetical protein